MILALIGAFILVVSLADKAGSIGTVVIGLILIVVGISVSNIVTEEYKARGNRRRYWAYGEDPDWVRRRNRHGSD